MGQGSGDEEQGKAEAIMKDKILGVHHSCKYCGNAFIELMAVDCQAIPLREQICLYDGYSMFPQRIWSRAEIVRDYTPLKTEVVAGKPINQEESNGQETAQP